jgi:hypothetical protein
MFPVGSVCILLLSTILFDVSSLNLNRTDCVLWQSDFCCAFDLMSVIFSSFLALLDAWLSSCVKSRVWLAVCLAGVWEKECGVAVVGFGTTWFVLNACDLGDIEDHLLESYEYWMCIVICMSAKMCSEASF